MATPELRNRPGPTDRAWFCGASGSGKTFAMLLVAAAEYGRRQIIVMDTKADPAIARLDAPFLKTASTLGRYKDPVRYPVVVYQPRATENNPETLDSVCQWIYDRQNTLLLIDEATQVTGGATRPGPGLLNAITRGRARHVSVWSGTQRPVSLPAIIFTEAEWGYCFTLRRKSDRATVDDYTQDGLAELVARRALELGEDSHPVAVFRAGRVAEVYDRIQAALAA